ncbi:indole-3-glycerol phosphate synthase TrpC [Bacillus rubiinfantis]|uniref:indole-3-glycerol phosphate synthase TrpC n=1 Tax=Bacillus rubiinfantis TaxID=1499680 RepID=UPI0005A69908|nr:indole-3-glycerol phosphate synthase TrpC [Bacillus rubiinfantis]
MGTRTILDQIIEQKKVEVALLREQGFNKAKVNLPKRSFINILQKAEELAVIAEFKRASPSKGMINNQAAPAEQAVLYKKNGASAISVLTDHTFFKGSFADLAEIRAAVELPILCKDFIIDPLQLEQANAVGADLVLLIVAALPKEQLQCLYRYATDIGLEVLVEVHNREELEIALQTGAKLIGINNRNLKTFTVSLEVTENLASMVRRANAYLISESGLHQVKDVERVRNAGANGILVGEALMKTSNLEQLLREFQLPLVEGVKK